MKTGKQRARVSLRPLTRRDWPVIEDLFGERGACGGCWCMAWRQSSREYEERKGAKNKRSFKRLVESGAARGVLAFSGDEPVGWCSIGPRAEFSALETKRSLATDWDADTWSVTCFFLRRGWRGKGVGSRLLKAAVDLAREHGARRVEGYPVASTKGPGAKVPDAFAWTGVPPMFERGGFRKLEKVPGKRPIYVRALRPR